MIEYDNGSQFKILFSHILSGSVFPAALPIGVFSGCIGLLLALTRKFEVRLFANQDEYLFNPFAMTTNCSVLGYLLVVRTNMALSRWMEGISDIQTMLSKWGDAYNSLSALLAGRDGKPNTKEEDLERVMMFRTRIAHWFSLMSCLAFATLRGSQLTNLDDIQIKELLALGPGDSARREKHSFTSRTQDAMSRLQTPGSVYSSRSRVSTHFGDAMINQSHLADSLADQKRELQAEQVRELDLFVLATPSAEEVELIEMATDKVNVICLWIIQGIIGEVRHGTLDIPPPIVTRVFQELSNGMLGFNQAHKVAMVPFPFPFAQMVSFLLVMMYFSLPFYVDNFTQNVWLTPLICFVIPFCYCGLNQIAIELEEPFGTDANDVDIADRHKEFLWLLLDTLRQPTRPPQSEDNSLERKIRNRIARGLPEVQARLCGQSSDSPEASRSLAIHSIAPMDEEHLAQELSAESDVPGSHTSRMTPEPVPAAEGGANLAGDGTSIGFGPVLVLQQAAHSTPRILGDEDDMSSGSRVSSAVPALERDAALADSSGPSCVGGLLSAITCVTHTTRVCTNFECEGNPVEVLNTTTAEPILAPVSASGAIVPSDASTAAGRPHGSDYSL